MRNAKNESNARLFTREQWLTKSQVQSFFSRLAAMRRKDQGVIGISLDEEGDVQCVQENSERQDLVDKVNITLGCKLGYKTKPYGTAYSTGYQRSSLSCGPL